MDLVELEQLGADDTHVRTIAHWLLGGVLLVAGVAHLTSQRDEFQAQVPS